LVPALSTLASGRLKCVRHWFWLTPCTTLGFGDMFVVIQVRDEL
jgi:hypothetical protein